MDTQLDQTASKLVSVDKLVAVLIETSHQVNHIGLEVFRSTSWLSDLIEDSVDRAFKEDVPIV